MVAVLIGVDERFLERASGRVELVAQGPGLRLDQIAAVQPGSIQSVMLQKAAQQQLKMLQWAIPAFAGAVIVLGAKHGDVVTLSAEGDGAEDKLGELVALLERDLDNE